LKSGPPVKPFPNRYVIRLIFFDPVFIKPFDFVYILAGKYIVSPLLPLLNDLTTLIKFDKSQCPHKTMNKG
jgi:hypothetical protein